jgi:hypothetical protein
MTGTIRTLPELDGRQHVASEVVLAHAEGGRRVIDGKRQGGHVGGLTWRSHWVRVRFG